MFARGSAVFAAPVTGCVTGCVTPFVIFCVTGLFFSFCRARHRCTRRRFCSRFAASRRLFSAVAGTGAAGRERSVKQNAPFFADRRCMDCNTLTVCFTRLTGRWKQAAMASASIGRPRFRHTQPSGWFLASAAIQHQTPIMATPSLPCMESAEMSLRVKPDAAAIVISCSTAHPPFR